MSQITFLGFKSLNVLLQYAFYFILSGLIIIISYIFSFNDVTTCTMLFTPILLFIIINALVGVFYKGNVLLYSFLSVFAFSIIITFFYLYTNYTYNIFIKSPELKIMLLSVCVFYFCTLIVFNLYKGVLYFLNLVN
jgi:hypothetical protein